MTENPLPPTQTIPAASRMQLRLAGGGRRRRLWLPLAILPLWLQQKRIRTTSLKPLLTVEGNAAWDAWSAPALDDDAHLQVDLQVDDDAPGRTLTLVVPLGASPAQPITVRTQQLEMRHGHWRLVANSEQQLVGWPAAAAAAAAAGAREPRVRLRALVDDPAALPRGQQVTLRWEIENGVAATLMGPLPGGKPLQLGDTLYPLREGSVDVRVLGPQEYQLRATVRSADHRGNVIVSRTVMLDADTTTDHGFVEVLPAEVLPYGEMRVSWAAWNVRRAALEATSVRGRGNVRPTVLGSIEHELDDQVGDGRHEFPLGEEAPTVTLALRFGSQLHTLAPLCDVRMRRWVPVIGTLPVPRDAVLDFCYAGHAAHGVLALCTADAVWLADVGSNDEAGDSVQFSRRIEKPADVVRFTGLAPHGGELCVLALQENRVAYTLRFYDLSGTPQGEPVPATEPHLFYTLASREKVLRAYRATVRAQPVGSLILSQGEAAPPLNAPPSQMAATRDGAYAAILTVDATQKKSTLARVDLRDLRVERFIALSAVGGTYVCPALAISDDGRQCATINAHHDIDIWDLDAGTRIDTLKTGPMVPTALQFTPDGRYLLHNSALSDHVHLLDLSSAAGRADFSRHVSTGSGIRGAHFLVRRDGAVVALGSGTLVSGSIGNGTLHFANASGSGSAPGPFRRAAQYRLAQSSDGNVLILGHATDRSRFQVRRWQRNGGGRYDFVDSRHIDAPVAEAGGALLGGIRLLADGRTLILSYREVNVAQQFVRGDVLVVDLSPPAGNDVIKAQLALDRWDGREQVAALLARALNPLSAEATAPFTAGAPLHPAGAGDYPLRAESIMLPAREAEETRLHAFGDRLLLVAGSRVFAYTRAQGFSREPLLDDVIHRRWVGGDERLYVLEPETGRCEAFYYGPAGLQREALPAAVSRAGAPLTAGAAPVVVDGLLLLLGQGNGDVPQDWVYNPQRAVWQSCGHGLDADERVALAYRCGHSRRLWALGGKAVGAAGIHAAAYTMAFEEVALFAPAYDEYRYRRDVAAQVALQRLSSWPRSAAGVALVNGWVTPAEMVALSGDVLRNTVIAGLANHPRLAETTTTLQARSAAELLAAGALIAFLDNCGRAYTVAGRQTIDDLAAAVAALNTYELDTADAAGGSGGEVPGLERADALLQRGSRWSISFSAHVRQTAAGLLAGA